MTRRNREVGIIKSLAIGAALVAALAMPAYAGDNKLSRRRPDDAILGEESGDGSLRWVVDPLDGTINYLYEIPALR